MKVIIEVNSSTDFDYEYFIDWLNDELANGNMYAEILDSKSDLEASIVTVDGKNKY